MSLYAAALLALGMAEPLRWQAPPGCPSGSAVRTRVIELLGRAPTEQELRVFGVVHPGPPWHLELETTIGGRRQRRALSGDDCQAVTEAAALILAVSVDPVVVSRASTEGPGSSTVSEPPPPELRRARASTITAPEATSMSVDQASPTGAPPPERARPPIRPSLRLGAGGEVGAIPGGTGAVRLGIAFEGRNAVVRVEGSYFIDRLAVLRETPTPTGATVGLGVAAVHVGMRWGGPRVAVPLSVGVEAGGVRTRGVGLSSARPLTLPWLAGIVGVGVEGRLTRRVGLWGAAELSVPVLRPSVQVGQGARDVELHQAAPVGARLLLGMSIALSRRPIDARDAESER